MNKQPRSITTSIVAFAVAVLVASWAINKAVELLVPVLPFLIVGVVLAVLSRLLLRRR